MLQTHLDTKYLIENGHFKNIEFNSVCVLLVDRYELYVS
jgi:hypothetical protein